MLLLPFFLEAKPIVVYGYGETPEQAKYNASVNLNKYVNGEYVTSLTEVSTSDTGNSALNSAFSDLISIATEGELIGVEYSDAIITVGEDILYGKYKVTATISDSLSDIYINKIKDSAKSIDVIYAQNPSTPDSKKSRLLSLLTEIRRYDGYKQVAVFLEVDLSELETYTSPITYQSINTELQSFLIEEEVELTNQKNSQRDTFVIAKIKSDLEANRKEQESLKARMENDAKLAEEMALINVENRVKSVLSNSFIGSMDLSSGKDKSQKSLVQAVVEASKAWNNLNAECNKLIEQEFKRIDNSLNAELKALENKAYRLVELSGNQPTEDAKRFRNLEINLLKEEKSNEKGKIETLIREGFKERLKANYEAFLSSIKNLNGAEFDVSLRNGDIFAGFSSYDGETFSWDLSLSLVSSLDLANKYEQSTDSCLALGVWTLSYATLSHKIPVRAPESLSDISARDEYNKYADDVEYYTRVLENIEISPYDISARYRLKYVLERDEFYIELYQLSFIEEGRILQEFVGTNTPLIMKFSNEKLNPKEIPSWVEIDSNVSESYKDVLSVIEREETLKAIEIKKAKDAQNRKDIFEMLKKTVSLDLEGGIGVLSLSGHSKPVGLLKTSLLVAAGAGVRFGVSPIFCFDAFDMSGILMTVDGNFEVFSDEDHALYLSAGMDFGFSQNDKLMNFYIGAGMDKVRFQFGVSMIGTYTSKAKIWPIWFSARIVDIF